MLSRLRGVFVFFILIGATFGTYFYAIADIPNRDHVHYMLERTFFQSDWDWLLHSLSWTRTRILWSGDYYLFRPAHMAVLALKDILFRDSLFAAGAVNQLLMVLAGFSVYVFSARLVGRVTATAIAVLFVVQHAGTEMVAWGHINPYLLALASMGFGLTLIMNTDAQSAQRLKWVCAIFLVGALTHEITVLALAFTGAFVLYALLRTGGKAEAGGVPLKKHLIWTMAIPFTVYLVLNIFDYFYHGAPPLRESFITQGRQSLFSAVTMVSGAPVVAMLTPFVVKLSKGATGIFMWNFGELKPIVIAAGVVLDIGIITGIVLCVRSIRNGRGSGLTLATLMALMMFCAYIFGMGYMRVYIRDITYLYDATYYYSVTAYIFSLLLAVVLHHIYKAERFAKVRPYMKASVLVVIAALVPVNAAMTIKAVEPERGIRFSPALIQYRAVSTLKEHEDKYCLGGFSPEAGTAAKGLQGILLQQRFCRPGDTRHRVYLWAGANESLWLADIEMQPIESAPGAHWVNTQQTGLGVEILEEAYPLKELSKEKTAFISRQTYERPDFSLTLSHSLNAAVILGYQNSDNFVAFRLDGPLAFVRRMKDGQLTTIMHHNAIPWIRPEYKIEVRHSGPYIFLFVDNNLVTFMPAVFAQQGRIGVAFQKSLLGETSFRNFAAASSEELRPPVFKPVLRVE